MHKTDNYLVIVDGLIQFVNAKSLAGERPKKGPIDGLADGVYATSVRCDLPEGADLSDELPDGFEITGIRWVLAELSEEELARSVEAETELPAPGTAVVEVE